MGANEANLPPNFIFFSTGRSSTWQDLHTTHLKFNITLGKQITIAETLTCTLYSRFYNVHQRISQQYRDTKLNMQKLILSEIPIFD